MEPYAYFLNYGVPVCWLAVLWCWEAWWPLFGWKMGRYPHAVRNLTLAVANILVMAILFGTATLAVTEWTATAKYGLLNLWEWSPSSRMIAAVLLLDAWMYLWHRMNHAIPLLWRFHRVHHSDHSMDVTTGFRFHTGELIFSGILRLGIIPVLGLDAWSLIVYSTLMNLNVQLHHADISLGRFDRWLKLLFVTPNMHKVHHSRLQPETDSNYSVLFSFWDRLGRSFRTRKNVKEIEFGLNDYDAHEWQTLPGILKTPFVKSADKEPDESSDDS